MQYKQDSEAPEVVHEEEQRMKYIPASEVEKLAEEWEEEYKTYEDISLGSAARCLRALLASAVELPEPPWDRICPVCGYGFAVDVNARPVPDDKLREALDAKTQKEEI